MQRARARAMIIIMRACACCVYVSECKLGGWGYGEERSDEGGVGMVLWRNRVRGEGVENDAVEGRL